MPTGVARDVCVAYQPHPEGEGGLDLVVALRETPRLRLHLFASPHFARLDLIGRPIDQVSDCVARACSVSPACHQITAVQALEAALGVRPSPQTEALRRTMALAHWIQAHALHIYFLAAPGLLGYRASFDLASAYPEIVQRALRLKKVGMEIEGAVGGRRTAPFQIRVNGFGRLPSRAALERARLRLERAKADVTDTVALVSGLTLPSLPRQGEHLALRGLQGYPVTGGRITSTGGLDVTPGEYAAHIYRRQAASGPGAQPIPDCGSGSGPLPQSAICDRQSQTVPGFPYAPGRAALYVGPLARLNLNRDRLRPAAAQALQSCGLTLPCFNPLASVVARAVELVQAAEECSVLLDGLELREEDGRYDVVAGEGAAATESPRGLLYHRYRVDSGGVVQDAEIVSPTAHNVFSIEEDLRAAAQQGLDLPGDSLRLRLEMLVRSYDPCATCSRDVPGLSLCVNA